MEQRIAKLHVGRLSGWLAMFVTVAACADAPRGAGDVSSIEATEEDKEASQRDARAEGAERVEQDEVGVDADVDDDRAPGDDVATASAARDDSDDEQSDGGADVGSAAPPLDAPVEHDSSGPSKVDSEPHAPSSADSEPSTPGATEPGAPPPSVDSAPNAPAADSKPSDAAAGDSESNTPVADSKPNTPAVDSMPGAPSSTSSQPVDAGTAHAVCGSIAIQSRDDVEDARRCNEIDGDLTVRSVGLTAIGADDLPLLTRITGNLIISGAQATDPPHLESVTLQNLRVVEGAVMVIGVAVVQHGSSGPLQELHLPALERIGAYGTFGLGVLQASLKVLDLPSLSVIAGSVVLDTLLHLCTVDLSNVERVGGEVFVRYVPRVPSTQLESLRSAAVLPVREQDLGCCAESSDERVSCEAFTEDARALYCTGC